MDKENKILIVDDEETLCEVPRFNLEMEGYAADVAYSAEEALALDLRKYSLILMDIMMGEISGTQMARILKKNPETTSNTCAIVALKQSTASRTCTTSCTSACIRTTPRP